MGRMEREGEREGVSKGEEGRKDRQTKKMAERDRERTSWERWFCPSTMWCQELGSV